MKLSSWTLLVRYWVQRNNGRQMFRCQKIKQHNAVSTRCKQVRPSSKESESRSLPSLRRRSVHSSTVHQASIFT